MSAVARRLQRRVGRLGTDAASRVPRPPTATTHACTAPPRQRAPAPQLVQGAARAPSGAAPDAGPETGGDAVRGRRRSDMVGFFPGPRQATTLRPAAQRRAFYPSWSPMRDKTWL